VDRKNKKCLQDLLSEINLGTFLLATNVSTYGFKDQKKTETGPDRDQFRLDCSLGFGMVQKV